MSSNQQQYEFIEYLGKIENGKPLWMQYLNVKDIDGIILK